MKLYITSESYYRIKNGFTNINAFAIVDVDLIISKLNLDMTKTYNIFLVNSEIKQLLYQYSNCKKYRGIIYIVNDINKDVIDNINNMIDDEECNITDLILLDDYDSPKLKIIYPYFSEIMYFSTFKKIKIIECKPIEMLKRNNI
jgi:hypothetical protein